MKNLLARLAPAAALGGLLLSIQPVLAQGTAFTYQGQLQDNGSPASGTYNLTFSLFNTNTGGVAMAGPVTNNAVIVTNGLFTVLIDFGSGVFTGATDWLQIGVESNGVSSFTPLTPRQELTPVPYAIYAENSSNLSGTLSASQLTSIGNTNYTLSENFFVGPSGNSTMSGSYNTADGFQAFSRNTTGNANTAYGFQALYDNMIGYDNTAVGYLALINNSSGYQNTAVGYLAMYMNSVGENNSAFGALALGNNSSGSFNVAIGEYALWSNGTGSYNTANGYQSLYSLNGLGSYNIALGYQAGYNITTGSSNIDIGNMGLATDTNIIRIGTGQTQALIAGVVTGNGAGLTNLNATNLTGAFSSTQLPAGLVTNNEPSVTFGSVTVGGNLNLPGPGPAAIYYGGNRLLIADNDFDFYAGPFAGNFTTTGAANTGLGYAALSQNGGGSFNAAVGAGALGNNTVGNDNTALGYEALYNNSTGSNNVANGYWALLSNTSGYNNTANGYEALYANSSGYFNTADGYNVLNNNTSGYQNTAMGHDAMKLNQVGYQNVALGDLALGNCTNDNQLVAIGYHALENDNAYAQGSTSDNGENTAIGYQALQLTTVGYGNTANGYLALAANTSGEYNTAIGDSALSANTSGVYNTAVGESALSGNKSGDFNIAIGFGAGVSLSSGSDNIYIGSLGASTDSAVIRIGADQTKTFIAGTIQSPICTSVTCTEIIITGGSDLAEPFSISAGEQPVTEGAVVVIDAAHPGQLKLTDRPYDTRVAGVVSGANGIKPGIRMQQQGLLEGGRNVALTGRVYVQADASNGAIEPGDLLTTSSMPGRAMKVTDHARAAGAILGKAMSTLQEGQGMVLVLVTLQ